jgi:hypothetical protein
VQSPTLQQVGDLLLFGVSYDDAMKMTSTERSAMTIILGIKRGGEYNAKTNKWTKKPTITIW